MKKTFQIALKDNTKIFVDAVEKTTNETSIRVHEFFEQDTPCLMLKIEHDELNTLLDLTKTSPYTLLYFHDRNIFEAAAFSNNEIEDEGAKSIALNFVHLKNLVDFKLDLL